jgi:hypothetical protein
VRRGEEEESLGAFLEERKAHLFEGLSNEVREGALLGGGASMEEEAHL